MKTHPTISINLIYKMLWGIGGLVSGLLPYSMTAFASNEHQPEQSYQCENAVVTKVGYYFEKMPDSGFYVTYNSKLGIANFKEQTVTIVDRVASSNSVMAKQKIGDRVQICLLSSPLKDRSCNPDQDPRGRYYRIYDYRLHAAYLGTNGNHLCGGA